MELKRQHKTRQGGSYIVDKDGTLRKLNSEDENKPKVKPVKKEGVKDVN